MPKFGQKSYSRLSTCEQSIQTILMEVVKHYDIMIVEGNRTAERQNHHWSKGRRLQNGADKEKRFSWEVVNKAKIVTYKDGYEQKSKHQSFPSVAVDVVPWPSQWTDKNKMIELRGIIKYIQAKLFEEGRISKLLDNGADLWDGFDMPHFQIK